LIAAITKNVDVVRALNFGGGIGGGAVCAWAVVTKAAAINVTANPAELLLNIGGAKIAR
jgi:hypothetical protein